MQLFAYFLGRAAVFVLVVAEAVFLLAAQVGGGGTSSMLTIRAGVGDT